MLAAGTALIQRQDAAHPGFVGSVLGPIKIVTLLKSMIVLQRQRQDQVTHTNTYTQEQAYLCRFQWPSPSFGVETLRSRAVSVSLAARPAAGG